MNINSINFKIRALFVIFLGAILSSYSLYLYVSLRIILYEELDSELNMIAQEIVNVLDLINMENKPEAEHDFVSRVKEIIIAGDTPGSNAAGNLQQQWLQKVDRLGFREKYIDFLDEKGVSLLTPANLKASLFSLTEEKIENLKTGTSLYKNTTINNRVVRTISYPYFSRGPEFYIIQMAAPLKPITHILRNRLFHIFASIFVILIISSLISKNFTSNILRPVFEISKIARNISEENLSARVEGIYQDKEMKTLVDTFNNMITRLEQSFKVISDFSSQVAHELKTPLTIIRGESDIALRRERDTDEYKKTITTIVEESNRMLKIIEDLLLLTRLDFPSKAFKFEKFNLIELLQNMYDQLIILALKKEIKVTLNTNYDHIYLNGNREHIRRMFLNLIDNAIKYTGINGRIDIAVSLTDKIAAVSISDSGSGIAETDLPYIFDRFYRADTEVNQAEEGTGMGLSIVKSIIDIHNGSIDVQSTDGTGTTFLITLPAG